MFAGTLPASLTVQAAVVPHSAYVRVTAASHAALPALPHLPPGAVFLAAVPPVGSARAVAVATAAGWSSALRPDAPRRGADKQLPWVRLQAAQARYDVHVSNVACGRDFGDRRRALHFAPLAISFEKGSRCEALERRCTRRFAPRFGAKALCSSSRTVSCSLGLRAFSGFSNF